MLQRTLLAQNEQQKTKIQQRKKQTESHTDTKKINSSGGRVKSDMR